MSRHSTDYLVVGAGAVGLAFADALLAATDDMTITIVDRHGTARWAAIETMPIRSSRCTSRRRSTASTRCRWGPA